MADEERNEQTEAEVADAGSDPVPEEATEPAEDQGSDPGDAEEPSAGSDPEPEVAPESGTNEGADGSDDAEEAEPLTPKQRRKLERSRHSGEALPQRDPAARASERAEARARNAAARRRRRASERGKRGEPGQGTPAAERVAGTRKVQVGTVVSDKADKTITVRIEQVSRHRRYEKVIRRSSTLHAHDEGNEAAAGDTVRVIEARPTSKTKRWRLVEVVEKAR